MSEVFQLPVVNAGVVKKIAVTTALKRAGFSRVRKMKGAPNFGFRVLRFGGWLSVVFSDQYGYRPKDVDVSDLLGYYQEALAEAGISAWLWEDQVVVPMATRHLFAKHVETNQSEVNAVLRRRFVRFDGAFGYVLADGFQGVVVSWSQEARSFKMACRMARFLRESDFDAESVEIEEGIWSVVVASRKAN
jgi:hypothetical protein